MMVAVVVGYTLCAVYGLWILYLSVMQLKRARDAGKLSLWAYRFGLPLLGIGLTLDVLVNIVICTPMMLELPQEWTVSARMSRHFHDGDGWRKAIASWIGANLLDFADPSGQHIK